MSTGDGGVLAVVRGAVRPETAAAAWDLASRLGAPLAVLHLPEADPAHYGFADTLAPSAAKDDFVAYVQDNEARELARTREAFARAGAPADHIRCKLGKGPVTECVTRESRAGAYEFVVLCGQAGRSGKGSGFTGREASALARRLTCSLVHLP